MNIKYRPSNYANLFKHPAMGMNLQTWVQLLYKNRMAIYIAFLPKALFLTFMIILNTPFHIYERLRYNRKIKSIKIKDPVFILGHPRSGTTYLVNILSRDPNFTYSSTYDVLLPNVFLTFTKKLKNIIAKSLDQTRPQDNVELQIDTPKEEEFAMANMSQTSYIHGFFFPKRINQIFDNSVLLDDEKNRKHWQKHYDYFLKKIAFKYKANELLLKSPANTARIDAILDLYPDAKFIHISRNPYDVYQSTERLYEKVLPITSFQKISNSKMEKYIIDSYAKMHHSYFEARKHIPENQIFEMNYEDFIQDPLPLIEKAYIHMGITRFSNVKEELKTAIESVSDYKNNTYTAIPETIKNNIDNEWKFVFDAFDYKIEEN